MRQRESCLRTSSRITFLSGLRFRHYSPMLDQSLLNKVYLSLCDPPVCSLTLSHYVQNLMNEDLSIVQSIFEMSHQGIPYYLYR
jgi:hypothetical protein